MMEDGLYALTNASAACSIDWPVFWTMLFSISSTPSENVGPGSTEFTVTPVPATRLARPRAIASTAVLVKP